MSEVSELSEAEIDFLEPYLPRYQSQQSHRPVEQNEQHDLFSDEYDAKNITRKPFVTLTYACSLDSMISLAPGVRTALSGAETKSMTHYLRLNHDAILVGVGTATADDPSLNCRYPGVLPAEQPRPIIVDRTLRWDVVKSKVRSLAVSNVGRPPWILHAVRDAVPDADAFEEFLFVPPNTYGNGRSTPIGPSEKINWTAILKLLADKGINSLMIEGGATVIHDLLSQPDLVDSVIITIAPTWLGQGGVTVSPGPRTNREGQKINAANLERTSWRQFGQDAVLCGRLVR